MPKNNRADGASFLPTIFLTVFLSMLGVTIVIPIIPALIEGPDAPFAQNFSVETRSLLYGLLIVSYSIMQFIGAPIWGAMSDRKGRKPILIITVFGGFIGYLLFGYAVLSGMLWLLFIARMIPGLAGGNLAVIYSSLADISDDEEKVKNFGMVGAAFGIGFIVGPGIGGVLADWFGYAAPFWVTAGLSFINMLLIQFAFPETLTTKSTRPVSFFQGINNVKKIFSLPNLRGILTVVLLVSLGFTFFTQFFALYLYREFSFPVRNVGYLFFWVGLWLAITQGVFVRFLSKKYKPAQILRITPFLVGTAVLMILLPTQEWQFYLVNPLIAIAYGITSPNMTAMVSSEATPEQQGEVLGINQSMASLGQVLPPLIGGWLAGFDAGFPMIAGSMVLIFAGVVFHVFYGGNARKTT